MSQLSQKKFDDQYASKKKKLNPRPEDDDALPKSQRKLMSGTKSISKSKLSTQKKCEVTFSEGVEEIKDNELNFKENNSSLKSTPYKAKSPSKTSLKSVKEHIKTPFSKIKDNSQDQANTPLENRSITNSATKPTNQPDFNTEILNESQSNKSNSVTPKNSVKKVNITGSKFKSMTKSPLEKIKEEKIEVGLVDNSPIDQVEQTENTDIIHAHHENIEKVEVSTIIKAIKEEEPSLDDNSKEEVKVEIENTTEPVVINEEENKVSHVQSEVVVVKEESLQENVEGVELKLESVDEPQENETVTADDNEDN
jgi:hypothetical protein